MPSFPRTRESRNSWPHYDDSYLKYTYDYADNVVTMCGYDNQTPPEALYEFVYTHTDRNQVSTITAPGNKTRTFYYNDLGQPASCAYPPTQLSTVYGYDNRNRLTLISQLDGCNTVDEFTYVLDKMGNITKMTDVDDAYWTYQYDVRYRLTRAQQYNSSDYLLYTFNYTYDKAGNMLTKSEVIPQGGSYYYSYEYNTANELTKETKQGTDTNFYYDAWGRMYSKAQGSSTATYEYRYGDKLKSVTSNFSGEGNVTYEYGGDGKRRKRQDSSATRQYNWDAGWNVISEENGCGPDVV